MANTLTTREKSLIRREFNNNGYVLNFSNSTFADFTFDSVGFSIQDKYQLSKGASLDRFFAEEEDPLCGKLLGDLIQERKDMARFYGREIDSKETTLLEECEAIADRLSSSSVATIQETIVKQTTFCSTYIKQQVTQMYSSIEHNPTDAIGKSKELLESCAKTILKERNVDNDLNEDFSTLMKKTLSELNLHRDSVPNDKKASGTIKNTLSSISTIVNGVNDLRNSYGTGHGKANDYEGLSRRHARLVVGLASSIVTFLWDTHQAMPSAGKDK